MWQIPAWKPNLEPPDTEASALNFTALHSIWKDPIRRASQEGIGPRKRRQGKDPGTNWSLVARTSHSSITKQKGEVQNAPRYSRPVPLWAAAGLVAGSPASVGQSEPNIQDGACLCSPAWQKVIHSRKYGLFSFPSKWCFLVKCQGNS